MKKIAKRTGTMKGAPSDSGAYFDYEEALRRLFFAMGGKSNGFGWFELQIAEHATHMTPDGEDESAVLSILRKISALRSIYASLNDGSNEGFWDFVAKISEIMSSVPTNEGDGETESDGKEG